MAGQQKTDPKVRFAKLREDQRTILSRVSEHKKEIEVLLQQLKALNSLIAEVVDEMEVQEFEDTIKHEREEREEVIESLDNLVSQTRTELNQNAPPSGKIDYLSLTAQQLSTASTENSISRLYELAEQRGSWSESQAAEFFNIQDAVQTSLQYNLAPGMQEAVSQTYQAIKTVRNVRGQDIQENYMRPSDFKAPDMTQFSNNTTDRVQQYKASERKDLVDKL